jgi:hypothetical protein
MKKALTVHEAAYLAKRSRRTIYHWIEWGALDYSTGYINADDLFRVEAQMTKRRGRPRKVAIVAQGA